MSAQRGSSMMQSSRKSLMPLATPARGMGAGMQTPGAETMLGRRSSVFSGRPSTMMGTGGGGMTGGMMNRESFFSTAPVAGGVAVDPRRLRDASVRGQMANELQDYLQRNNYELETGMGLTGKTMTSPTQKEFAAMFKWLYNRIDPSYRFQKNLDVEIPPLLKQLRYPFEKSITRSQIAAVGGNNWHTFLGLLHWLMQLAVMMDAYNTGNYDYATMEAGHDVKSDRIIYRFMTEGYSAWLSVDDSAPDDEADKVVKMFVDRMADDFREVNKDLVADVDMLEAEKKSLEEQIEKLEQDAEYGQKLDEKADVINSDIAKYSAWIDKVEQKKKRNEEKISTLNDDINKLEGDLTNAEREKREYQDALSKQGITIQDLDRMTSEMERLEKSKAAILTRADEVRARLTEREMEASRKLDELERMVANYNSLAYKIGLVPSTGPNAKGQDFELVLTTNPSPDFDLSQSQEPAMRLLKDSTNGYMPYQLLNLDLNNSLRPFISSLRKEISDRQDRALEEHLKNHSLLDRVSEAVDDKQAEVEGLRHKIRAAEEEYDKTKDNTTTQKMHLDAQIERMEKELAKLRQGLTESIQMVEQREINTNLEYVSLMICSY
jgi:kinetochore protein NDC80